MQRRSSDSLRGALRAAGLRVTPQRLAILETFASACDHPTAQTLYQRLLLSFPTMSFATVYNTLDALSRVGLCGTLRLGTAARFDPNTAPHHHAVCDLCDTVVDLPVESLGPDASHAVGGFEIRQVERLYRGVCAACQRRSPKGASTTTPRPAREAAAR